MKRNLLLPLCLLAVLFATSCKNEDIPVGAYSNGDMNTTTYVAIGNSITAGYQSGALWEKAQAYSYPNLIAKQLSTHMEQPLIPAPGTGSLIRLAALSPSASLVTDESKLTAPSNLTYALPYNNLGIPGAVMADAAYDTSNVNERAASRQNPFFPFVMRNQAAFGKTLVDQAVKLNATVVTFWLGNNDVLGYATSGGVMGSNTGLDGFPPRTRPTEPAIFQNLLLLALSKLKAGLPNAKVLVANIPDVTSVPFFNTVPRKIPNPADPSKLLDIYFKKADGTVAVVGTDDYVLLTAQAQLAKGVGFLPTSPLGSQYVLDASEAAIAIKAVSDFNAIIQTLVANNGYSLVDINAFFTHVKLHKFPVAGEIFTTGFITGGLFSLDGVHPSSKGQALIANKFIEVMNRDFKSNIPYVDISSIPGITAPGMTVMKSGFKYSLDWKVQNNLFENAIKVFQ